MPARRASGLPGTHIQPPDHAVAPPNTGSFSTTMTFRPCHAAVTAADNPPAPDPMTRTSHSSGLLLSVVTGITVSFFIARLHSCDGIKRPNERPFRLKNALSDRVRVPFQWCDAAALPRSMPLEESSGRIGRGLDTPRGRPIRFRRNRRL